MTGETEPYMSSDYDFLAGLVEQLNVPKKRILFLHVRLKGMRELDHWLDLGYDELTKLLLDVFQDVCRPKTILVPTFTYTFTDSGIYHRVFSNSEVGRFSEEVRLNFSQFRTPDPIFSVVDTTSYLNRIPIDYTSAFGEESLFEFLHEQDAIIVNWDLPKLLMTQVHYIEKKHNVSYRYDKQFSGVVYKDNNTWRDIEYTYFVRDLDEDPQMDYKKREEFLRQEGGLETVERGGIVAFWISAQEKFDLISDKLQENERFLLE